MTRRRAVGRPAVWHKSIIDFVERRGEVRALEIQKSLGIPKQSLYHAIDSLIDSGQVYWSTRKVGNYRFLKIKNTKQLTGLCLLAQLGY